MYFTITIYALISIINVSSKIITSGSSEWGTLCKLNATEFQPENVGLESRLISLFPGLRSLDDWQKPSHKPCCFTRTWESEFVVQTRRIGRRPRSDRCLYRIRRNSTNVPTLEAIMVIGQTVLSNSLCDDWRGPHLKVCPKDEKECLHKPYLGEPRCISEENGFHYIQNGEGMNKEMWFTDARIPTGGVKRHIYTFSRKYEVCRLESYQLLIGQYVDSKSNCRMMFLMDQLFIPSPGTFNVNFNHSLLDDILQC